MSPWPGAFPDDVGLGVLLEATSSGWRPWFEARGPVDLVGRAVALDASGAVLEHLADLPVGLRGLSLAGLPVTDQQVAIVVRRLRSLSWLDLRGTRVTATALTTIRRLRRLRRLGLDEALLSEAGRRPSGTGLRAGVSVVTEGGHLIALALRAPLPDTAGFNALVAAATAEHPGAGVTDSDQARSRAAVLLDAGCPEQALALLAPMLVDADPALLLVAARAANEIGTAGQALAPLALGAPTVDLLAWRGIFLSRVAPAQAVLSARAALREAPDDSAALWATCSAYLNAGQIALAERALIDLQQHRPEWPDTAKLAARLARVRHRYRDEIAAWHRVLADQPDDADALAGLARAQRSARPLSTAWMTTMNSAATVDVRRHGLPLLEQVTRHRRHLARVAGVLAVVAVILLSTLAPALAPRIGLLLVAGLLAAGLTAGLLWFLTPMPVRQVVRRTDDLTGTRHRPDWRRGAVGALLSVLALAIPIHLPTPDDCGDRASSSCPEPTSRPQIDVPLMHFPDWTAPTFSPVPLPTFAPIPVPTLDP